jgi:hypothetical protein
MDLSDASFLASGSLAPCATQEARLLPQEATLLAFEIGANSETAVARIPKLFRHHVENAFYMGNVLKLRCPGTDCGQNQSQQMITRTLYFAHWLTSENAHCVRN